MKLILSADWQSDVGNLDLCKITVDELIAAAHKYKADAVIHLGDVKDPYNPVSLFIAKFMVRTVRRFKDEGIRFIIQKGNHDRLSQSAESKDWLDILRAAGAETVSKPRVLRVGDGLVAFLPYTSNKKQEREWANKLLLETKEYGKMPRMLAFHTEIYGASLNSSGIKARGITRGELHVSSYDVAVGGHLHEHQLLGKRTYYCGSPFCQDWGEANQTKGNLLVSVENAINDLMYPAVHVRQLKTSIPGWYDAEYLARHKRTPEPGAYVRSRVQVTAKKIMSQLTVEEQRLAKLYPGTRQFVVHKQLPSETLEVTLTGTTDAQHIAQYVASRVDAGTTVDVRRLVAYMSASLGQTPPGASGKRLRFLWARGKNVLCYGKIAIDYRNQGLVLVRGINKDWPKRSNGSGKTSALSLLPLGLCGESLKGQKNDEWAAESNDKPASLHIGLKDERNRMIEVIRDRRPHRLRLMVDGNDESSGLTGKRKIETQGEIERVTGYDLQMLTNSVYIDQTIANGFVFGTQKTRMDLVSKICNLERYEVASKIVSKDVLRNKKELEATLAELERHSDEITRIEEELAECVINAVDTAWQDEAQADRVRLKDFIRRCHKSAKVADAMKRKQAKADSLSDEIEEHATVVGELRGSAHYWQKEVRRYVALYDAGKCSTCGQATEAIAKTALSNAQKQLASVHKTLRSTEADAEVTRRHFDSLETIVATYIEQCKRDLQEVERLKKALADVAGNVEQEQLRNDKVRKKRKRLKHELAREIRINKACKEHLKELERDSVLLDYAQKAFHRSGLPMYLAAALCPVLNKSAEEYAELFTQSKLQVHFAVVDGEFVVDIVNPAGSETRKGQSVGETAMAGILTAFSLREVAPRTNLLILDEPGHGLDPQGAKQFALGLLQLAASKRFRTILVTTHSPIIEGLLAGSTTWTAIKQNGISSLHV